MNVIYQRMYHIPSGLCGKSAAAVRFHRHRSKYIREPWLSVPSCGFNYAWMRWRGSDAGYFFASPDTVWYEKNSSYGIFVWYLTILMFRGHHINEQSWLLPSLQLLEKRLFLRSCPKNILNTKINAFNCTPPLHRKCNYFGRLRTKSCFTLCEPKISDKKSLINIKIFIERNCFSYSLAETNNVCNFALWMIYCSGAVNLCESGYFLVFLVPHNGYISNSHTRTSAPAHTLLCFCSFLLFRGISRCQWGNSHLNRGNRCSLHRPSFRHIHTTNQTFFCSVPWNKPHANNTWQRWNLLIVHWK